MRLIVGRIAKPHGIRGEVLVDVRTDDPGVRFAVGSVLATDSTAAASAPGASGLPAQIPATLTIEVARPHLGRYILLFEGYDDRTGAESLRGVLLCVDSSVVVPSDDPDDFSDYELIGLAAVDPGGERIGEIVTIDHAPAADLLVIRRPGGRNAMVPFVKAMVPEVDIAGGRVVLTLPEGLLDL
jgi:16S rRNA processing protein RimM